MDATVDTLIINIEVNSNNAQNQIKSVESELQGLGNIVKQNIKANSAISSSFKGITSGLASFASKIRIAANLCGNWFNESNDYVESLNLFRVSMGEASADAEKFAKTLQNLMGIDIKEWMEYQGSFNQIFEGFGIDDDKAAKMSQQLTQLSYDLSSYANIPVENAFKKIQSGMSGQIKGLKEYGLNLSVAQLKETALAHGITLSTSKMTERQKAMLRYVTLMEKSVNIQNDMARTIVTPANAMRILSQQMIQLKRALGNIVSVLVSRFIPYIQLAVQWLTELANKIADFFGYELPDIDYTGIDSDFSFADDLDDSLSNAADTAKELKKTLMGFDEINALNGTDSSSSSLLGGGLPSDLGLEIPEYDFTEGLVLPNLENIKDKLKDILWYVGAIGAGLLAWKIGSPGIGLAITGITIEAKGIIDTIQNGLNEINFAEIIGGGSLITVGGALIGGFFGEALIGGAVGAIVAGIPMFITGVYDAVTNGLNTLNALLIPVGSTLAGAGIGAIIGSLGGPIGAGIGALIGLAVGAITDMVIYITQNWEEIKNKFTEFENWIGTNFINPIKEYFAPIFSWIYDTVINPVIQVVGTLAQAVWEWLVTIYNNIADIVSGIWEAVNSVAQKIGEIVNTVWQIIVAVSGYIWEKIKELLNKIKNFLLPIVNWIYEKILQPIFNFVTKVTNWISDKIQALINLAKNVAITVANGVAGIIKGALNSMFSVVENIVNFFIHGLNSVVDIVNNIPGVSISKVTELSIPRFAEGGYPNQGQAFIAREAGPELVGTIGRKTAVVNNDQIVESVSNGVYRAVREAMSEGGESGESSINLFVTLDGETVYKNTVKRHNDEVKLTGSSPLMIGG